MCGFVGVYYPKNAARHHADLQAASEIIRYRGPDGDGFYDSPDGACRLAFRRLSIIDLATGDQPLIDRANGLALVGNGEIYNYQELRAAFTNYPYATHGDMETVLALKCAVGDAYVDHLNGMYGLALYDEKSRALDLVRDRLGIKPLYWAETAGGAIVFGSEIKALFATGLIAPAITDHAAAAYLSQGYVPGPETLFTGVYKLAPGHRMRIDGTGNRTIAPYWRAGPTDDLPTDPADIEEHLVALMEDAVRIQLRADVPVGALLSGGIDSGLVTALAAQHTGEPLRTFTARFQGSRVDESPLAALVAERYGTRHTVFDIDGDAIGTHLPKLIWHMEEPLNDPAQLPNYLIEKALSADVRVTLNGTGGDELFAGYSRYFQTAIEQRYALLPAAIRQRVIEPLIRCVDPFTAWKLGRTSLLEEAPGAYLHAHSTHFPAPLAAKCGLPPSSKPPAQQAAYLNALARHPGLAGQSGMLVADIETYLTENLLPLLDRTAMMVGVEGRVPLLDHRLVEAALAVPTSQRTPGGLQKGLQRKLAAKFLPEALLTAPKHGFVSPVPHWLSGAFGQTAVALLCSPQALNRGWWTADGVRFLAAAPEKHGYRLYTLLTLEMTARMFVDSAMPTTTPDAPLEAWSDG